MPALIDWNVARALASGTCGLHWTPTGSSGRAELADWESKVDTSHDWIHEATGWSYVSAAPVEVMTRQAWIARNVDRFAAALDPLAAKLADSTGPHGLAAGFLGAQAGLVLGQISQRVLGQYDLAIFGPPTPPSIIFLSANIDSAARALRVDRDSFRWHIALHETTHAAQFAAHPWLEPRLRDLANALLQAPSPDLRQTLQDALALARARPTDKLAIAEVALGPAQRVAFRSLYALMAIVEGFGDFVMHKAARGRLPDAGLIEQRISQRRKSGGPLRRLFGALIGLELKLDQYELGESFANRVASLAGDQAVWDAWRGVEWVPSIEELRDPEMWLRRTSSLREARAA